MKLGVGLMFLGFAGLRLVAGSQAVNCQKQAVLSLEQGIAALKAAQPEAAAAHNVAAAGYNQAAARYTLGGMIAVLATAAFGLANRQT